MLTNWLAINLLKMNARLSDFLQLVRREHIRAGIKAPTFPLVFENELPELPILCL